VRYNKEEIRSKYRDLFEYSLDYIYVHDLKGNFLDANEITLKALEYEREEILSLNFLDVLADKEQLKSAIDATQKIINGNQQERSTYRLKTKSNKTLYLKTYGIPLKRDNEIYAILGIGTNITRRKLAEDRVKESEERFRNLFEKSPFGIIIIDFKGIVIDCNPTIEELTGYGRDAFKSKHFTELPMLKKADIPILFSHFKKMISGIHVHRMDIELIKKDGDEIWINLQASVVKFENRSFIQVIVQDISKRKEAELLISKELQKLKELDDMRKNLMVRISHELKTPLLLITGGIEYLFESGLKNFDEKVVDILKTIERASSRLKKLIENLIEATKINHNKLRLNKKSTDLNHVVEECIEDLWHLVEKRNLNLKKNTLGKLNIKIDELRIKQVITNLLINAIKNTPPHGNITVSLERNNKFAKFIVKDTGIGLTQKEMSILFTQFGKIERDEQNLEFIDIQGSGLGLFISKAIVDMHGGQIRAESEGRNKGAKFFIKLPLRN